MPIFERDQIALHYEEQGEGFPVLLIAPGGMKSAIRFWESTPWNPIEQLKGEFRVIAMDQRNAGSSTAPVTSSDGWHSYIDDQLALMDHLRCERFHVAGMCIGGPYCLGLIERAPERVASATLFQTIGRDDNQEAFYAMFDNWAEELQAAGRADADALRTFRENMYGGAKVLFNVDENFVAECRTPLLVFMGDDLYHPASTSRMIADKAPNAKFVESWKEGEKRAVAQSAFAEFLRSHSACADD